MRKKDRTEKLNAGTISPDDAAKVMTNCYAERAGEEVLLRALIAERNLDTEWARFWVRVYERFRGGEADSEE